MFRGARYLEKTEYVQINLDKALTIPGNGQRQEKTNHKFTFTDRNNWFDWYDAYFRVDFTFEATADGAAVGANAQSAPINGSFSLINKLAVKSSGKPVYNADNIHKLVFIKNLLDFSDDFARSGAKKQFWYLDTTDSDCGSRRHQHKPGNQTKSIALPRGSDSSSPHSAKQIFILRGTE